MNLEEQSEILQADKKSKLNDTNALGVEGYPTSRDPELAEWFPMPSKVKEFHDEFCKERGLDEIPVNIELSGEDQEDNGPLIKVAAVMVTDELDANVSDLEGLSVVSPKGRVDNKKQEGLMIVETYSVDEKTVYLARSATYEDPFVSGDLKDDLTSNYNIPRDACKDYVLLYLATHSIVHHIQSVQGRTEKKPEGNDEKAYYELDTEKEAHKIAIKVTDDIWEKTVSRQFIGMS